MFSQRDSQDENDFFYLRVFHGENANAEQNHGFLTVKAFSL